MDAPSFTVAYSFVGATRLFAAIPWVWDSLLTNLVKRGAPQADVFFNLHVNASQERTHHYAGFLNRRAPPPPVCDVLERFAPARVHVVRDSTCANESAREDIACCSRAARAALAARGELASPNVFAHGALQYYHVLQALRDVRAHELRVGQRYHMVVRLRPDLAMLQPLAWPFSQLDQTQMYYLPKGGGSIADWFWAIPRALLPRFEPELARVLNASEDAEAEAAIRATGRGADACASGPFAHAPEYALAAHLARWDGGAAVFPTSAGLMPAIVKGLDGRRNPKLVCKHGQVSQSATDSCDEIAAFLLREEEAGRDAPSELSELLLAAAGERAAVGVADIIGDEKPPRQPPQRKQRPQARQAQQPWLSHGPTT